MKQLLTLAGLAIILAGCSTQRNAQATRQSAAIWQLQSPPDAPAKRNDPLYLLPEGGTVSSAAVPVAVPIAECPGPEPITATVALTPPTPVCEFFTGMETQHVKCSATNNAPRPGQTLAVPLSSLAAGFVYPLQGKMISKYGMRSGRMHTGVDIKAALGDTIRACMAGVVRMSKPYSGYGNLVVVRHECGLETVYAHNSRNLVSVNDRVRAGQAIALAGRTGRATTEHLHFEVRAGGLTFNPDRLLDYDNRCIRTETLYIANNGGSLSVRTDAPASTVVAPEALTARTETPAARPAQEYPATASTTDRPATHTIARGEYLYMIARRYGMTVDELCEANGITKDARLSIGQVLSLGGNATVTAQQAKAPAARPAVYTVKKGDSLYSIARAHSTTVEVLCEINGLSRTSTLSIGQKIKLA